MINVLKVIIRPFGLFESDLQRLSERIFEFVYCNVFLVLGGAVSIRKAVVNELYRRLPKKFKVVDLSENALAELMRSLGMETDCQKSTWSN